MSLNKIHELTAFHHRHIDEVMILHQEALLLQKLTEAEELLMLFEELLTAHIEVEDHLIFPAFDACCTESRWPSQLYYKEHEKISSMLDRVKLQFSELMDKQDRDLRRRILSLLDYEKSFKGVLEHHTEREEQALLPDLEKALGDEQLSKLKSNIEKKWNPIKERQHESLERIRKNLL